MSKANNLLLIVTTWIIECNTIPHLPSQWSHRLFLGYTDMEGHFRLHLVEGMFQVVWGWDKCSRVLGMEGMFHVIWGEGRLLGVLGMFQIAWVGGHFSGYLGYRALCRLLRVEVMFHFNGGGGHVPCYLGWRACSG